MRQSTAPNRTLYGSSLNPQAAAEAKLLEKKKEYDAVSALERASKLYLQRIEGLADDFDTMADAGQVHGEVLAQWPAMFQTLNLFLSSRTAEPDGFANPTGERLVRIPIEELQQAPTQT